MNISTGGPHILLFERDPQLTALLTSEFQLVGYECHAARTAVEVFDAIARYPIQLVVVNLAQAAARRHEFWVALDIERKGRGVQVFTFQCMNLAGYGPYDAEEYPQTVPPDAEVDGMRGLMSLVDAVRTRVPVESPSTTHMVHETATSSTTAQSMSESDVVALYSNPPPVSTMNGTTAWEEQQSLYEAQNTDNSTTLEEVSSLAQLSRMIEEHYVPDTKEMNGKHASQTPEIVQQSSQPPQVSEYRASQSLRASPIQDLPIEKGERVRSNHGQVAPVSTRPLASISPSTSPLTSIQSAMQEVQEEQIDNLLREETRDEEEEKSANMGMESLIEENSADMGMESLIKENGQSSDLSELTVPNNAMLLDIVQSLPPMSAPPTPSQVLSGRATRSLGSVLLEGHLVPQSRLEVAQTVQRMLRGVDLNYQLGEILLMFKLLTPDQLLAGSLVSHGLITAPQISALGRIRRELHSLGLEYDLESLLILFRMLTPEQLREAKSTWQG